MQNKHTGCPHVWLVSGLMLNASFSTGHNIEDDIFIVDGSGIYLYEDYIDKHGLPTNLTQQQNEVLYVRRQFKPSTTIGKYRITNL